MALLILPIGVALGWFLRSPKRAAVVTAAVGVVALVVFGVLALSGAEVSPLETIALVICTPLATFLSVRVARWRISRDSASR
jgi:hypothetical protein